MVRSVSLIVLCIFAKRFVLSVSGFLSQRNFCTTAVLLWGTHWGAVSWIVLFFSCRAIPRARFGPSELGLGRPSLEVASPSGASGYRELGQAQFGGQILITLRISASARLCAQRFSACPERGRRIPQRRFSAIHHYLSRVVLLF